jgi:hypothetical protein
MDTIKAAEYSVLIQQIRAREKEVKAMKKKAKDLETELLPDFKNSGTQRINIAGGTVWLNRKVWASAGGDMPRLVDAMKAADMADMVGETVNGNTLSAWVREFDKENLMTESEIVEALPEELREAINVEIKFTLGVTATD